MAYLRSNSDDVLTVYKLDRVARSLPHLIEIMADLNERAIGSRRMTDDKINAVRELLASGTPVKDAAAAVGVSVPTLYRWLPGTAR